jgi:UDP-N-acetyl-D-mannosaminuronic acid dehydrogenase
MVDTREPVPQTVCMLGLGYVGLPMAAVLAVNGFRVIGVDVRADVVEAVNAGQVPIEEVGLNTVVQAAVSSGHLTAQVKPSEADVFIIAVPTPIRPDHTADLTYVESAARSLLPCLRPGNLVVLESTVPPNTTDGLLTTILSESGLKPREELFIAHCPERILPGRTLTELVENDRVIGGIDRTSAEKAAALYGRVVEGEVIVTSAIVAELVKLVENASRDVGIAFANEVARIARSFDADGLEVIEIANRHPRVNILRPGPGVGGHCIPVDPWFLVESAPDQAQLISAARLVNDTQPQWVADRVMRELAGTEKPKISVWGVAYKADVDDARETPARHVIAALKAAGAEVTVLDFHVKRFAYPLSDLESAVTGADCLLVLTDHREFRFFEPEAIGQKMRRRLLFDTRNFLPRDRWEAAGFIVISL